MDQLTIRLQISRSNTTEQVIDIFDRNTRNRIVLEYDTFENLEILPQRERFLYNTFVLIHPKNQNLGYTKLPTVSITSTINGSGGSKLCPSNGWYWWR